MENSIVEAIISLADRLGTVSLLALLVVALLRGWIVPGGKLRQQTAETHAATRELVPNNGTSLKDQVGALATRLEDVEQAVQNAATTGRQAAVIATNTASSLEALRTMVRSQSSPNVHAGRENE
ncbi:MAG: hypothetical protein NUW01_04760 [Gemmatimonadaceae bacterium]|nr:hypothetical protein [Gemmatimonadaceae bacterium]